MNVQDLGSFLSRHSASLLKHVSESFPPVIKKPGELPELLRKPLGKQALAITAAAEALAKHKTAIVVGEMGSGKSFIAAATAAKVSQRALILCPPHLVEKWRDEINKTTPDAEVVIAETISDLETARAASRNNPGKKIFVVMSRERAKLGAPFVNAGIVFKRGIPRCVHCNEIVTGKNGDVPGRLAAEKLQRPVCSNCQTPLYAPDPSKVRRKDGSVRYPLAEYVKRRMSGFFDLLILDEAHEYKAADSAQGIAAGILSEAIPRTIILTGTLFGGYASTLFFLLWRFVKPFRQHFGYNEVKKFVEAYGAVEYIETYDKYDRGVTTRRGNTGIRTKEVPATSPLLLYFLLPFTIFLKLGDVADDLPLYTEEVRQIEPGDELKEWYEELMRWFRSQDLRKNPELLGSFFHASVFGPDTASFGFNVQDLLDHPPACSEDVLLPKEEDLLDLVAEERAAGRRVIVFVQNTGERNLAGRLEAILKDNGYNAKALYSTTTSARRREKWIRNAVKDGIDVLILHPRLVQTGLDLIDFPTLVYYQTEPSVYVLRQAARRSWRIGQRHPVRVVYMVYKDTLQGKALAHQASKAQASLALEGHLLEGGLNNMANDEASVSLARSLAGATNIDFDPEKIKIATLGIEQREKPEPSKPAPDKTAPPPPIPVQEPEASTGNLPTIAELERKGYKRSRKSPPENTVVLFPELLLAG